MISLPSRLRPLDRTSPILQLRATQNYEMFFSTLTTDQLYVAFFVIVHLNSNHTLQFYSIGVRTYGYGPLRSPTATTGQNDIAGVRRSNRENGYCPRFIMILGVQIESRLYGRP
uniref:Uncharacterized protein n=1 Tax=Romanomermis culicivorax TaxID=13658 RepID=A0A915K7Y6_ROMCU